MWNLLLGEIFQKAGSCVNEVCSSANAEEKQIPGYVFVKLTLLYEDGYVVKHLQLQR